MPTPIYLLFTFLLGAALLFMGLHLRAEPADPLGVVPEEVKPSARMARIWGSALAIYGGFLLLFAAAAMLDADFRPGVVPFRRAGVGLGILFGFWVVFLNRKVEYLGRPAEDAGHGHH
ncbi:MAG: hypothetical protein U0P81_03910 [Holophagaceae bacterium]